MKHIICLVTLLVTGTFIGPAVAAAAEIELEGYAWASTIGWISMNCDQTTAGTNTCASAGGHDYSVSIDTDTNLVTGHAWSPNVGWIQFGGLGDFPTVGTATINNDARVVGLDSDYTFTGWARACSATDGGNCSSMETDTNTGGWDGWISLSGAGYGVVMMGGEATSNSFAWGGPQVMGWIDFSPNSSGPTVLPVRLKSTTDITIPAVGSTIGNLNLFGLYDTLSFQPTIQGIPFGETVTWTLTLGALTDSGTVTQTASGLDFSSTPLLTNVPFSVTETLVFEVDMPEPGVVLETNERNVYTDSLFLLPLPPPTTFEITGPEVIRSGEPAIINWAILAPYNMVCSIQGPGFSGAPFPVVANIRSEGPQTSSDLFNAARFELVCDVPGDSFTDTWQVEVIPTFQEV